MGVVHKFKPEVVDFVVQQKKENISFSCRRLAALVENRFQIKVSKSSVNNILKQASLSSPPKRRTWILQPKKFKIPHNKKKQLLEGIKKVIQESAPSIDPPLQEDFHPESNKEAFSPETIRHHISQGDKDIKNAGLIFLKAAAWMSSMGRYVPLLGAEEKDSPEVLMANYFTDKAREFINIYKINVYLEDGGSMCFDPYFGFLWNQAIPGAISIPMDRALGFLSKNLISNKNPVMFHHLPENSFSQVVSIFENISGKRIQKIDVFGEEEKLACFDMVPFQRRIFMSGVWKWQNDFTEWTNNVHSKNCKEVYIEALDRVFKFCDGIDVLEGCEGVCLRVLIVWTLEEDCPFLVILTNHLKVSGEKIVFDYLMRWPCMDSEYSMDMFKKESSVNIKIDSFLKEKVLPIERLPLDFKEILHAYCRQHFFQGALQEFSYEQAEAVIYSLSGECFIGETFGRITLSVPEDYPHEALLHQAAKRVNQSNVSDDSGRRWLIIK
ncbi:hypothetical protein MNBD_UNCLBAC01-522 [hydrothermal vent metagenome]|uniref:Uncharacterized protein n=1 Tax=hydrothermal vent metagenome TaxID=652676 RepID=A0A3B1DMX8_9ZZZZ